MIRIKHKKKRNAKNVANILKTDKLDNKLAQPEHLRCVAVRVKHGSAHVLWIIPSL